MNIRNTSIICLMLALVIPCFMGCGPSRPPLGKIEGTVYFDGEPIKSGTILFSVAGARDASGRIEDGVIRNVTTFDEGDGVPVGEARIAVLVFREQTPQAAPSPVVDDTAMPGGGSSMLIGGEQFAIPARFTNPESSGLTATITRGTNTINLELSR